MQSRLKFYVNTPFAGICDREGRGECLSVSICRNPFNKHGKFVEPLDPCEVLMVVAVPYSHRERMRELVCDRLKTKAWQKYFDFGSLLWNIPIWEFPDGLADPLVPEKILEVCRTVLAAIEIGSVKLLWALEDTDFGYRVDLKSLVNTISAWGFDVSEPWSNE